MSYSGEAADQVVRISLNGAEVAAKLSGAAAKEIAVMLYAILSDNKKSKGKTRLANMLKSGKELKVFAVRDEDLAQFCRAAKEYGVLYCILKDRDANDGITDLMVKAEDASKINRIYERFQLATVDRAAIKTELTKAMEEGRETGTNIDEKLIEKVLEKGEEQPETEKEGRHRSNPTGDRREKSALSEPSSGSRKTEEATFEIPVKRPSVKKELEEIKAQQRQHSGKTREQGREKAAVPDRARVHEREK